MELSVVCPVYNEEEYIEDVLSFFIESEPKEKELFLIDGGSADKTVSIIEDYQKEHSNIHVIHNPDKFVPYALNLAIPRCKADIIVRLDAHTKYATDYLSKISETFNEVDADIVGGPMRAVGKTPLQKAVAYATSTKFGVGDSNFHDESYRGYSDSVYLGSWKSEIFENVGYFDTRMLRNQDDEFHYRAKSHGYKVYLNPDIRSEYYPRNSFKKLASQYYQYGLFKPLVLRKVRSEVKLRHLIPLLFCLYIISLPLALIHWVWLLPLFAYLTLDLIFSFKGRLGITSRFQCLLIYPILHFSYGWGFLRGLLKGNKEIKI